MSPHEPMDAADWMRPLDEAAMLLVVGPEDEAKRLRAVQERLAAAPRDRPPAWVRTALERADSLVAQGLDGSLPAGVALRGLGELLELVAAGVEPPDTAVPPLLLNADGPARELFPEFLLESHDYLAQAEAALLELETNAAAPEAVNVVFRAFHSIKSSSAFLGLEPLAVLAHDAESLLCPVRDGATAFGRAHADLLLGAADTMRELLAAAKSCTEEGTPGSVPRGYAPLRERMQAALRVDPAAGTPDPAPPADGSTPSPAPPVLRAADGWARVRTIRLDQLIDLVGELVVAQSMVAQDPAVVQERHGPLARKVLHTSKLVRELQELGIALRMVPLRPLFQRLQRLVRDLAAQSGKQVELVCEGEDTDIDRTMVELLADPLVHMVRNAVDHALEPAAERIARGKPAMGTLRLSAHHAGGAVLIELRDDGRGLDRARILQRALDRGIVAPGETPSPAEIDNLIFTPGLSTAATVSEISGRGVGMDVVRRNIEALRGRIDIETEPGVGTGFTLRLPLTLAVTDGMLVRVGSERYIVPTFSIVTTFRPAPGALTTEAHGGELVMLHGTPIPIVRLHHAFDIDDAVTDPASALLVVVAEGAERYALLVDEILGQHQFVAKPLATGVGQAAGLAGAAVLGDGRVGLILDPAGVLASARRLVPWMGAAGIAG